MEEVDVRAHGCLRKGSPHGYPIEGRGGQLRTSSLRRVDRRFAVTAEPVTGRHPHDGFWDSDHAGLFSVLRFP
jgi:hypothetical protein